MSYLFWEVKEEQATRRQDREEQGYGWNDFEFISQRRMNVELESILQSCLKNDKWEILILSLPLKFIYNVIVLNQEDTFLKTTKPKQAMNLYIVIIICTE